MLIAKRSIANWLRRPVWQSYEAVRAVFVSDKKHYLDAVCRRAGVELDYVFHDHDRVIKPPTDKVVAMLESWGSHVSVHDGGHLDATCKPDTLHAVLRVA